MKKSLSFIILSLIAFLAISSFIPKAVLADGMVMWNDPYSDRWDYSGESSQQAFINYEDGTQKMIISIGLEGENNNGAVWLFPIPADPNKITLDVFKDLPNLNGEEISGKAKNQLDTIQDGLQANQIYTIPFILASKMMLSGFSGGLGAPTGSSGLGGSENGTESDVSVYGQLDKEGISSEIITAKTADGLYNYLKNKGLKVESGSIYVLDNYIGKNFSFVVSWLTSSVSEQYVKKIIGDNYHYSYSVSDKDYRFLSLIDNLNQKYPPGFKGVQDVSWTHMIDNIDSYMESQPGKDFLKEITQTIQNDPSIIYYISKEEKKGVFVTFPTKDIYFPLIPTSAYGNKIVPATIRVFGHVSPKIFENIKKYTKTSYYLWDSPYLNEGLEKFAGKLYIKTKYSGNLLDLTKDLKYTKIEINAPSKFLTDDLWISNQAPMKTYYPNFISSHPLVFFIILLILSSALASILAGMITFRELRNHPIKLGLIGLFNCLTLFGLFIATFFVGTKNKNEEAVQLLAEIKQRGYFWKRRLASFFFIIFIPFLLFDLFFIFMLIHDLTRYNTQPSFVEFIFFAPFIFGAVISLIIFLVFKRIKIEDKDLFQQLKLSGYSSWSFQLKDKMKYVFVPVFSVSFLIISWLLVKLVGFTV